MSHPEILLMSDDDMLSVLYNAPIVFWACPTCPGSTIKWFNGVQARCMNCGKTNTTVVDEDKPSTELIVSKG
jgi:uncharacterized Zn finger protein